MSKQHGGGFGGLFNKLAKSSAVKSLAKQTATSVATDAASNMLQSGQIGSMLPTSVNPMGTAALMSQAVGAASNMGIGSGINPQEISAMIVQYRHLQQTLADMSARVKLLESEGAAHKTTIAQLLKAVNELNMLSDQPPNPAALNHAEQTVKAVASEIAASTKSTSPVALSVGEYALKLVEIAELYDGTKYRPDKAVINMLSKAIDHQRRIVDLSDPASSSKFIKDLLNKRSTNQQAQTLFDVIRTASKASPVVKSGPEAPILSKGV